MPVVAQMVSNISRLDDIHVSVFRQALTGILATDVAELTFAQIIDGLPTKDSFLESKPWQEGHLIFELNHVALCPGALEKTRGSSEAFDPAALTFPLPLLASFQETSQGTKQFQLKLIELLWYGCHKHSVYEEWRDQPRDKTKPRVFCAPAVFFHKRYLDFDQYPNGIADIVGHWAEAKIFGGVVVFDRGESGTEQFGALIEFLTGTQDLQKPYPIPIHATNRNRWRYDPNDAITRFNIFRDRYERKPRHRLPHQRNPVVNSAMNWPELEDRMWLVWQQYDHLRDNPPPEQADIDAAHERLKQITPSSPCWASQREP
ncbi:hypothetical protein B0H63DRAFT_495915 [Podospora didyma]|uniref:Uncharacterized protein n=1 Tax=Podospora didyma TaxID=330526 RepID=A0AAE0KLB9_9PEZI|nr:hypothetical protein B0H63DRAFT_495915 [Podospora didyma]